ncbi:MAG: phenylalanine--tRNA ligase subunit alpha [Cenarchaeum sp. SB0665_bin_23]|nr:phenylalanine--tRNA ligase subunit alpha [Cenarchaeum sp. SB0665_bin_23]MXZ94017.1 phenylalanine--tRNA ligase subunit alpha [Cenarchaeum sp. SB0666_bin_15]MYB47257.1 phenylalanine--tRNA ligase subunit alpha [Cenarchaeum sp. SB0662_bin_33]MYD58272.1 phenylalanine--tRNA ligase subunit alpha [Cenarchaeum sp. SB0678_bin_8]MYG32941.1 phenylalanine--tRNA ligase subunit alpha [Cenarchaeum sp. SB0677_bin_16]MYJ28211.1 phenylalanine--tRNA ligase subunit alpha [Cenarchaeum sp. SB0672_bin_9]
MDSIYHPLEDAIILHMKINISYTIPEMAKNAGIETDQARRATEWLLQKGDIRQSSPPRQILYLGPEGQRAKKDGLPEQRLMELIRSGMPPDAIRDILKSDWGPAVGICRKNNWIRMDGGRPIIIHYPDVIPDHTTLQLDWDNGVDADRVGRSFSKRPGFVASRMSPASYMLSSGEILKQAIQRQNQDTPRGMNVEADVAASYAARTHPLYDIISEIREIFVTLGFDEIHGSMVQPSFWNFDALFTPQDHPAREMQDTFYVRDVRVDTNPINPKDVAKIHNECWRYVWDYDVATKPVLRTHNTCVTIRHLALTNPQNARIFSLGRVFRNEKPSYKHLVEFHQVEGVVVGPNVSLRDLMGIQREFYNKIGLKRVKFWPTFFPYTEPSLQSMVYNERLGKWVELFGMGIFRPEVTGPLGIKGPVLAWGGGIERIAMMRYQLDDVREFYRNGLDWLRGVPIYR